MTLLVSPWSPDAHPADAFEARFGEGLAVQADTHFFSLFVEPGITPRPVGG